MTPTTERVISCSSSANLHINPTRECRERGINVVVYHFKESWIEAHLFCEEHLHRRDLICICRQALAVLDELSRHFAFSAIRLPRETHDLFCAPEVPFTSLGCVLVLHCKSIVFFADIPQRDFVWCLAPPSRGFATTEKGPHCQVYKGLPRDLNKATMSQSRLHHAGPLVPAIMFDMSSQLIGCAPVVVCQATFSTKQYPKNDIEYYKSRFKEQLKNITDAHEKNQKMFNLTVESMSMKALIEGAVRQKTFEWNEFGKIALSKEPESVSTDWSVALALLAAQAADRYEMIPHTSANAPFPNTPAVSSAPTARRRADDASSSAYSVRNLLELRTTEEITNIVDDAIEYENEYIEQNITKPTTDLPFGTSKAIRIIKSKIKEAQRIIGKFKEAIDQRDGGDYHEFLERELDNYASASYTSTWASFVANSNDQPLRSHAEVIQVIVRLNKYIRDEAFPYTEDQEMKKLYVDVNKRFVIPIHDALLGTRTRPRGHSIYDTTDPNKYSFELGITIRDWLVGLLGGTSQLTSASQMNTTSAQGAPTVFTPTTLLEHVGRAYVPRSFLMDICITLCGIYESGLAFTPRPTIPDSIGLEPLEKAKILIGIVSGLNESESMEVFKAMCPSEGAAERFLVAFREWYNYYNDDRAKQFKAFYTTSKLNDALSKLFQGITADDKFPDSDEELCKLGIDFQATKAIFQLPLRGDPCLDTFPSALKTPARGHTLCRLAHPIDFVLKSNAIALGLPENTMLPFLDIVESHLLHNAQDDAEIDFRNELAGYRLLLKRITEKDRDLLRVWLDNLKETVLSLEAAIDTKPMTIGQLSELVTDADATLQSVHNIIEDPTTLLPELRDRYRMHMIERMIRAHEDDSRLEQRALLDQLIGVLNDANLNDGSMRALFDQAKAANDPIKNLLERKQVKGLLCKNSNLFTAFGHILFGR